MGMFSSARSQAAGVAPRSEAWHRWYGILAALLCLLAVPARGAPWTHFENEFKKDTGALAENGTAFRAGGAHMQPLAAAPAAGQALVGTVRVAVPAQAARDWASAALAFFGPAPHQDRFYALLITGDPGRPADRGVVSLWHSANQLTSVEIPLHRGQSYTIKAELAPARLRMKAWAADEPEPTAWQTQAGCPDFKAAGIGVRTYGAAFDFDKLETALHACPTIALQTDTCQVQLDESGIMQSLAVRQADTWEPVALRQDGFAGPAWVINGQPVALNLVSAEEKIFAGRAGDLSVSLRLAGAGRRLAITAGIANEGTQAATNLQAGVRLGIDCSMERFPDWNDRYFPTLLRCEKTHFWGYLMTPRGRILTVGSPDPVASWHLEYKPLQHRIYTATLDLLNPGPLPARHPAGLDTLAPGQKKQWTIYLEPVATLEDIKPHLAESIGAPLIDCDRYTVAAGQTIQVRVAGGQDYAYQAPEKPGVYPITQTNAAGKVTEALISVRQPWSWYARAARAQALAKAQKGSSHTESWYGLFSCYSAQRLFPDAALDGATAAKFNEIWPLMYDMNKMVPSS